MGLMSRAKLIFCTLFVLVVLVGTQAWATNWYVIPDQGPSHQHGNGLYFETAWNGFKSIQWHSDELVTDILFLVLFCVLTSVTLVKWRRFGRLIGVLLVILGLSSIVWATDWYVRPSGGSYGDEDGTSYADAWDGFSNIVWGTGGVEAGDTLWVCGIHNITAQFTVGTSGNSGFPITIRGDYSSDPGIIDGQATVDQCIIASSKSYLTFKALTVQNSGIHGIHLIGSSNVIIDGCTATNNHTYGITINSGSSDITIQNCSIHSNGTDGTTSYGVYGLDFSHDIIIKDCVIYNNSNFAGNDGGGCVFTSGTNTVLVQNCSIYSNGDKASDGSGVETLDADHVTVKQCVIYDTFGGVEVRGEDSTNYPNSSDYFTLENCLIYNVAAGVTCGEYPLGSGQDTEYGIFRNNTIVVSGQCRGFYLYSPNQEVKNNIIYIEAAGLGAFYWEGLTKAEISACTVDYNDIYLESGATQYYATANPSDGDSTNYSTISDWRVDYSGHAANSIDSDPLFLDPSGTSNFHLRPTSPCIDAGTPISSVTQDLDGHPLVNLTLGNVPLESLRRRS